MDKPNFNGDEHTVEYITLLGEYWPGIQIYHPPVKWNPAQGAYEDFAQASFRFKHYALNTEAHTLIFDLEDGCRQKEMSRVLLRKELPNMPSRKNVQIAIRINPFNSEEYKKDILLIKDLAQYIDVVILAKAGVNHGINEVSDLCEFLLKLSKPISIQPIIEHPNSLKIIHALKPYSSVKHIVFGIHDFSKAMGIQITAEGWIKELSYFIHQILLEARIARKGVIGGVDTLIGKLFMPPTITTSTKAKNWIHSNKDRALRLVFQHACEEAALGMTGKQVIHPNHINPCKVAFIPSLKDVQLNIEILQAGIEADVLLAGAIKFNNEMYDPPMFGKALQTLLRAYALRSLSDVDTKFAVDVIKKLPQKIFLENWPYSNI